MSKLFETNGRVMQSCVKPSRAKQVSAGAAVVLAFAVLFASPSLGQQPASGDAANPPAAKKKVSGRLPAYFASVVTKKQREAIYTIQADYGTQLEKLRAQMATLIADRTRKVDEVLDADQLAEVTKKRDEAKEKRAARSGSKPTAETATDG